MLMRTFLPQPTAGMTAVMLWLAKLVKTHSIAHSMSHAWLMSLLGFLH